MRIIRGKKAVVTGAASGVGRAIALALAQEGADLYLFDIDKEGLDNVVAQISALGVECVGVRCNIADPGALSFAVEQLLERWGSVDILINNAGIAYYGPTERMTAEQWNRLLGVNLLAPIQLTRELLPTLLALPEAHILNVCSISGLVAGGRFAAYHVSKFGLVGFTEALRAEYGRRGIGVTALCPGPVQTNLYLSAMSGKNKAVPNPPAWLCVSEAKLASAAIRAIRRNRRMVILTPMAHVLWFLKRFAPGLLDFAAHTSRKKRRPNAIAGQPATVAPPVDQHRAA